MSTFRFSIEEVKRLVKKNNKGDGFKLDAVYDNRELNFNDVWLMAKGQGRLSGGLIIHAFSCTNFQDKKRIKLCWHNIMGGRLAYRFDISNDFCNEILKQKGDVKITVNIRSSNISFYKTAKKYNKPKPFRIEF